MKKNIILYPFLFIFFLFFLVTSISKKKDSYSNELFQLIKANSISGKVDLKKVNVKNKDFEIFFIKINREDQKKSDKLNMNISKIFLKEHKVVNVINNYDTYQHSLLIISSKKYFNDLKFIFTNKKLNNNDMNLMFEIGFKKDDEITKYLLKKREILNCKPIYNIIETIKYCKKNHHLRLKNYEIPEIIFNKYKYFYFKIDNDYLRFKNAWS